MATAHTAQADSGLPTTTDAVAADTQTRVQVASVDAAALPPPAAAFDLGAALRRRPVLPYQRQKDDPLYRPLRIYTMDPAAARLDGAVGTLNVAFEPLGLGPCGALFRVDSHDHGTGLTYRSADLDARHVLIGSGYTPSPSDPRFHQQMVYAVCSGVYSTFRTALGRHPSWGFGDAEVARPLLLRPHHGLMRNACYVNDHGQGEIQFGYYRADAHTTDARSLPGGFVFTCLSHDVVAHEVSHALLDGLRAHFSVPSGPDVPAFHEGFADLVAIFQHFSYREVVLEALRRCRGRLEEASLLTQLAQQFGHTTGEGGPLRSAVEPDAQHPRQYDPTLETHQLGSILVSAVFEAFIVLFRRRTAIYLRLATDGSGSLRPGEMSPDLQTVLAEQASKLASQVLTICIRAIDYCPPVGMNFGDYLRALITADADVVPDDRWDYRGALIEAFRRRNIHPRAVGNLSEDALVWRGPRMALPPIAELHFGELRFSGDPAQVSDALELQRQAQALGRYVSVAARRAEFGLVADDDPRLQGDTVGRPCSCATCAAARAGRHSLSTAARP